MRKTRACLVINPKDGQNMAKLTAILAVLAAAGWETDIALKEYGGHTMELATEAAKKGYDVVIAYGGDGTLNQVVNGAMNGKSQKSMVGLIPGGTANVWANEVGIPADPVKAALTLVSSEDRRVDIGRVEVKSLAFLPVTQRRGEQVSGESTSDERAQMRKVKPSAKARHNFILMAGLGVDAAIMSEVNKSLKERIGVAAVGLVAAEKLPGQHTFPLELCITEQDSSIKKNWQGNAIQVVIGNTRHYADVVEMTPDAYIDDGLLDVCVITAGEPLSTLGQISSLLFHRKPDNQSSEFFRGAHITLRAPASIDLQLDGSAVKLNDYLSKADRRELQHAQDKDHVMVTYELDALPRALDVAFPPTYNNTLFERASDYITPLHAEQATPTAIHEEPAQQNGTGDPNEQQPSEQVAALLEKGRKVTFVGMGTLSEKKHRYIVAGNTTKAATGEVKPVAVLIDKDTGLFKRTGEMTGVADMLRVQEGAEVVVEGKKSKRGVIHATRVVL
ncbi:MAG TPA: diacylglycerol kinase family protein [Ktedonobacteraceae bacterium]|nr:diacylglycerol kinase family protein [Ktedonobacteraceae bacterium]